MKRYEAAGGRYYVCPICFNAKQLDSDGLIAGAELQGTVPMWNWIGDERHHLQLLNNETAARRSPLTEHLASNSVEFERASARGV